jgi:CIC family chloride channel protein
MIERAQVEAQARQEVEELEQSRRGLLRLGLVAVLAGGLIGLLGGAFRLVLLHAADLRADLVSWSEAQGAWGFVFPVLAVALCAAAARALVRLAPEAGGSGVQRVEAVMRGEETPAGLRVIPVKFVGGALALGSGLALGREGPTVQMGAVIGATLARWARLIEQDIRDLGAAVAGAGLGVAFSAPIGGALFTFEEVRRAFTLRLVVASLLACSAASGVALLILGAEPDFVFESPSILGLDSVLPVLVLGALLGALGVAYNRFVVRLLDLADAWPKVPPEAKAAVIGAAVGLLLWFEPLLVGGGDELNQWVLEGRAPLGSLLLVLAVRWFLGPLSYAAGTPGGLFAPLLLVGAAAGALFAGACNAALGMALDPVAFAIIGMSTFFTAVVRAPFTGIVLIVEMTATTTQLMPMLAAAGMAMAAATLLRGPPVYDTLRLRMLRREAAALGKETGPGH